MSDRANGRTTGLELSEARFRAAVTAVGVMWTNDPSGRMAGQQPAWAELTGQTEDEYQGCGWASAVHPDDAQPTLEAWNQAVAEKRTFDFEHRVLRRNGQWRHFSIRAVPVMQDGDIVAWVGVHIDITDKSKALHDLTWSEQRSQTILGSITDGFFTLDREWRFDYVNPGGRAHSRLQAGRPPRPRAICWTSVESAATSCSSRKGAWRCQRSWIKQWKPARR